MPEKWKLQTKVESFEKEETGDREEEHPREVSVVDLETTRVRICREWDGWRGMWIVERDADGRMDGWTDGRAHRWRVARSEKGCRRIPMALHRPGLQPHRRLYAPDVYRGATRVVARGGATSIGGLLPVALVVLLTEGWIGARFHARRSTWTAWDARASFMLLRSAFPLSSIPWFAKLTSWLLAFKIPRSSEKIANCYDF